MSEFGSRFLHKSNPQFHLQPEVEHTILYLRDNGERIPDNAEHRIGAYIRFLADKDYGNFAPLTGDSASREHLERSLAIKLENIPDSYFDTQIELAFERGIHAEFDGTDKLFAGMTIQADQERSLRPWFNYLASDDARYPDWFKLYAYEGLKKMAEFDSDKQQFKRRSLNTTTLYPGLSRQALAAVYGSLNKQSEPISFPKLYAEAVLSNGQFIHEDLKRITDGTWVKYDCIWIEEDETEEIEPYIFHPTVHKLVESLQPYQSDWCTAGAATASEQLQEGDFYVFYSNNEEGQPVVPRLAIRMEVDEIAEIRGVDPNQEVDEYMLEVLDKKLRTFGDQGEIYLQKIDDMKRIRSITQKLLQDPSAELNDADLRFMYEVDRKCLSFGYDDQPDPRLLRLKELRKDYTVEDGLRIFNKADINEFIDSVLSGWNSVSGINHEYSSVRKKDKMQTWFVENIKSFLYATDVSMRKNIIDFLIINDPHELVRRLADITALGDIDFIKKLSTSDFDASLYDYSMSKSELIKIQLFNHENKQKFITDMLDAASSDEGIFINVYDFLRNMIEDHSKYETHSRHEVDFITEVMNIDLDFAQTCLKPKVYKQLFKIIDEMPETGILFYENTNQRDAAYNYNGMTKHKTYIDSSLVTLLYMLKGINNYPGTLRDCQYTLFKYFDNNFILEQLTSKPLEDLRDRWDFERLLEHGEELNEQVLENICINKLCSSKFILQNLHRFNIEPDILNNAIVNLGEPEIVGELHNCIKRLNNLNTDVVQLLQSDINYSPNGLLQNISSFDSDAQKYIIECLYIESPAEILMQFNSLRPGLVDKEKLLAIFSATEHGRSFLAMHRENLL